jgi:ABC-2 type transport system permease protein
MTSATTGSTTGPTTGEAPSARTQESPVPSIAVRARDLVASEWTKFRSVRSTFWVLLVAVVSPVGASALVAFAFSSAKASGPAPDPLLPGVLSLEYAVIAVCVLGVLAFSSEFSTGLIRTTFAAAPRRRAVLAAKAVVLGAVTLAVGEVVVFASFFLSQAILSGHGLGVSLAKPGVPGKVLAAGLVLCVCTELGLALGAIIRHTAGGIAATVAVIVLPAITGFLPSPWGGRIGRFTLLDAVRQVSALHPGADLFSPGWSLLVLLAWPAVALAVAAVLITRRDV